MVLEGGRRKQNRTSSIDLARNGVLKVGFQENSDAARELAKDQIAAVALKRLVLAFVLPAAP
jgi:hypothetical protein